MPLESGSKLGPYEILNPIGAGGMGEVYRARDERLAREVAIKILPPSFLDDPDRLRRFEQEARATGQLNHPNILAVYDTGDHEGTRYVVEELLDGETLRKRLDGGALPARKAIDFGRQIARGLSAAHQKGIVHRDLKPENLFVTNDGRVKILDFGLAKLTMPFDGDSARTAAETQAETGAGVILGTAGYMSPEQVRGNPVDHRSDLFSFGGILYEMLTGKRAFHRDSSVETMTAILREDPPEISRVSRDVPPGLDRIVQHCLEKSPDERFQSASDLAFQLDALSGASGSMPAADHRAVAARGSRVRPVLAALIGFAVLAAAFFAGRQTRVTGSNPTYSQLTFRQGRIVSARFTPDAKTAVYSASWDGNPTELFSTRPGNPGSRSLELTQSAILSVSSSGELAVLLEPSFTLGWMRTGTLARFPLSGGVPRQILKNVQDADWAPDGQTLAVVRSSGGRYSLEYPTGTVLFETEGWISSPRFSRDGERIGFLHHPGPGDDRGVVGVVDLSGVSEILTDIFSSTSGLAWSPSGEEIWFTAGMTGNVRALYAVDLEGNQRLLDGAPADLTLQDVSSDGQVLLTRNNSRRGMVGLAPGEETERDLSWLDWSRPGALSSDGKWLLFEEQGQGGGPEYAVYLRGTDGSPPVRLGSGLSQSLSPDGRWALTIPLAQRDRFVMVPRGAGQSRTVTVPGFSLNGVNLFPDDEKILLHGGEAGRPTRLFVLESEGGTPRPISPEGTGFDYALSPAGDVVAATGPDLLPRLYPVDGGEPRAIPGITPGEYVLGWGPDGRSLFVTRRGELPTRIYRLDLSTGNKTLIKELMPADTSGLIDIGYIALSSDGRSHVYSYRRVLSTLYLVKALR